MTKMVSALPPAGNIPPRPNSANGNEWHGKVALLASTRRERVFPCATQKLRSHQGRDSSEQRTASFPPYPRTPPDGQPF
jgi:hypothetical protein